MSSVDATNVQTLVIFLVGSFAFILYFWSKHDEKVNAARIIIGEIRSAESAVELFKSNKTISEEVTILPTNSWNKYSHLFVNSLDSDEFRLISIFYTRCAIAEETRKQMGSFLSDAYEYKGKYLQRKLVDIAGEATMKDTPQEQKNYYEKKRTQLQDLVHPETYWFVAEHPKAVFSRVIISIPAVTTSSAGQKLKAKAKVN